MMLTLGEAALTNYSTFCNVLTQSNIQMKICDILKVYASFMKRLKLEGLLVNASTKKSRDHIEREYQILEDIVINEFPSILLYSS
jgi:hypothetical protein